MGFNSAFKGLIPVHKGPATCMVEGNSRRILQNKIPALPEL